MAAPIAALNATSTVTGIQTGRPELSTSGPSSFELTRGAVSASAVGVPESNWLAWPVGVALSTGGLTDLVGVTVALEVGVGEADPC